MLGWPVLGIVEDRGYIALTANVVDFPATYSSGPVEPPSYLYVYLQFDERLINDPIIFVVNSIGETVFAWPHPPGIGSRNDFSTPAGLIDFVDETTGSGTVNGESWYPPGPDVTISWAFDEDVNRFRRGACPSGSSSIFVDGW